MKLLRAYVVATARYFYLLLVGAVGAVLTVVGITAPKVVQIVGVVLLALGLLGAQFRAWTEMRRERDKAVQDRYAQEAVIEAIRSARAMSIGDIISNFAIAEPAAESTVQVGVILRNFGTLVLSYQVESMRVEIEGRTLANPQFDNRGSETVPPGSAANFYYPSIGGMDVTRNLNGELEIELLYGHPDLGMARRLYERRSFMLLVLVGQTYISHAQWTTLEMSDESIKRTEQERA